MVCESMEHVPDRPNIHSVLSSPLCLSVTAPALGATVLMVLNVTS